MLKLISFITMQTHHILLLYSIFSTVVADNSCIFEHPTMGVINLTSIGLQNGQPRFRDVSSISSTFYKYSFNPCYSFVESNCQNAAVCQSRPILQFYEISHSDEKNFLSRIVQCIIYVDISNTKQFKMEY